jgi:hypothetical protein
MTSNEPTTDETGATGRIDDATEAEEQATEGGAAAEGEYDAGQGSPGGAHPVGEDFPDEAVRYDDPDARPRSDASE